MKIRNIVALAAASLGLAAALPVQAAWPERPITMIVPYAAGGGTDAVARYIATEVEKDLKQPVNVVNRAGGSGVVGHQAIAMAKPDGYTVGLISGDISTMRHAGLTQLGAKDFSPIALVNFDPSAVFVRSDSPVQSVKELLDQVRANPGKIKGSGAGQGGIWHLGVAGMLVAEKLPANAITWVPSNGAAAALQDLMAGGIEMASCSIPEARSLIDAGRVRTLALMDDKPDALYPKVPLLKSETGSTWINGVWRGVAGPKGMQADNVKRLADAIKKVYDSQGYKDFLASRGFGAMWIGPEEFSAYMAKEEELKGEVMKAAGLKQ